MRLAIFLCVLLFSSLGHAALTVRDFRTPGDRLLVSDSVTGLEWLSPRATNTVSYNAVVGGFDGLIPTEKFAVATEDQVLAMMAANFNNPTVFESSDNVPKATAFFNIWGITLASTCSGTVPPGACPRTQAWSTRLPGNIRALGMITIGNGARGNVIDFTGSIATQGGLVDSQRGTWLVRRPPAMPAPAANPALLALLGALLLGVGARARLAHVRQHEQVEPAQEQQ